MPTVPDVSNVREERSGPEPMWDLLRLRDVHMPFRGPRRFNLDEPEGMLDRWLREFADQRTGGSSPPPMH